MANDIDRTRFSGENIVVDHVDKSTSKLSTVDDDDDDDGVDTTLKLSKGGGGIIHYFLEEKYIQEDDQKGAKFRTIDDHVDKSTSKLSIVDDDGDGVDTTLKLSTSVSSNSDPPLPDIPIIPEADFRVEGDDTNVVEISAPDHFHTTSSFNHASGSTTSDEKGGSKSGKRKQGEVGDEKKRRSVKRKRDDGADDDENSHPIPSLEEIPGLVQTIESSNGTRPVFLYRKKLEESDVSEHHSRLFVTRREKFMEFLTDEENTALNHSKQGLEILAVDPQGKLYKLGLKIWQSLKMMVLSSDWKKLVNGNNGKKGDWVEIWGYREEDKLCFAINFRKSKA